ncbi:IS1380 family transposase [bacterium]|nr:IS1380 family transposase [bacterium]
MPVSQGLLPFYIELTKKRDFVTAYAGLPLVLEAMLAVIAHSLYRELRDVLGYKSWKTVRRHLTSLVLLIAAGGEHISDLEVLRADHGLEKLIGFRPSSPTQAKDFLYRFHQGLDGHRLTPAEDAELSVKGRATIRLEGPGLQILELFLRCVVDALQTTSPRRRATLDVDACIVEANKKQALKAYEGTVGFQPQMSWWAEQRAWVCDQFRDGNVPAAFECKDFLVRSFANLPEGIEELRMRGDSAFYNEEALTWLDDQHIDFAVTADMVKPLARIIEGMHEGNWQVYRGLREPRKATEEREWAEVVDYVPDWKRNNQPGAKPFRYIAIRIRPAQQDLFEDAERQWRHFCVITNMGWEGGRLLRWHREKQGTVEFGHGVMKNDLGAGIVPTGKFGANAAWWRINALTHNLLELIKLLDDGGNIATARPKTLRFRLLVFGARLTTHARTWSLRLWEDSPQAHLLVALRRALVELAALLSQRQAAPG